jgi:hypothetical protein
MEWEGIAAEIVLALGSCSHLLHFLEHLSQGCQDAKGNQNITSIQQDFHISKSRAIFFIQQGTIPTSSTELSTPILQTTVLCNWILGALHEFKLI